MKWETSLSKHLIPGDFNFPKTDIITRTISQLALLSPLSEEAKIDLMINLPAKVLHRKNSSARCEKFNKEWLTKECDL